MLLVVQILYLSRKIIAMMEKDDHLLPLVSIVSISYDHTDITCLMLESLRNISYPNIEVIIVDNKSPNDDPDILKIQFPEIQLVKLNKNIGFAGANNIGIKLAKGKYVLLLNNDTEVTPGFLEPLVDKLEKNPKIGIVSPKIRFFNQPDTLQFTTISPINKYTARSKGFGFGVKDIGQFNHDSITAFAHGAAMMAPVSVIREVGLMPDIYFLYYEELDWCEKFKKSGYHIYYVHNSLIYHKESISTGRMSPLKTYYMNRARILFIRRNILPPVLYLSLLYQLLIAVPKNALYFLLKGKTELFLAYAKAVNWNISTFHNKQVKQSPLYEGLTKQEQLSIISIV